MKSDEEPEMKKPGSPIITLLLIALIYLAYSASPGSANPAGRSNYNGSSTLLYAYAVLESPVFLVSTMISAGDVDDEEENEGKEELSFSRDEQEPESKEELPEMEDYS